MLANIDDLLAAARKVYSQKTPPKFFGILEAALKVREGAEATQLARLHHTTPRLLTTVATSTDPIEAVFKTSLAHAAEEKPLSKARQSLGQMVLGSVAERAFEKIYKETMGTEELHLEDFRESRNETDYRVLNGARRQVFRINIKFHGSQFENAQQPVGLDPSDCFALATYKIWQANKKEEEEKLPYLFVVVGVPGLRGESVGHELPQDLVHLSSFVYTSRMSGKRNVEDAIVEHLIHSPQPAEVHDSLERIASRIAEAEWRVISAKKADKLLRTLLFDRVYAVRVNRFNRNYPRAEVDMHFSISQNLTKLSDFLALSRQLGLHGLTARLTLGEV